MKHEKVALEVLRKLLDNELKSRARTNLVQSRRLMEMIENTIRKYQNNLLTSAQVIDELIKVSKEIVASIRRTLRTYGYPPDMQLLVTETVLKQAEMIAGQLNR